MRHARSSVLCLPLVFLLTTLPARGDHGSPFEPDPRSVQRYGPAYRYPQAGWIVLHIEGEPYERGYQHGRLMAAEIASYIRCFAALQSPKAPTDGWKNTRTLTNALFVRRYDKEYLEEMKGIADGATAVGARFDNRPLDLVDIVALNAWPEVETLNSALEATPTGLEGVRFPHAQPVAPPAPKPMHCSAFAATGPATKDGKIVFGHITMFGLYPSTFFNIWLDVKPAKGHRVLMQTYPGGIQSGLDYYMNDAGLLICETTIAQTRFDIKGQTIASRIRQALQYADSIDKAVDILKQANNGLYTNEWLLADTKSNEIAMFELGTAKSKLWRSGNKEWFGGTEGFYWGCNNTKDREVRLETVASVDGRPANVVFCPSDRDKVWLQLYAKHKGKIDAGFGKEAFTTPPIAAYPSLDAKVTTTELAKELKTVAMFGPPLGRTWQPTLEERRKYPEIQPLVSNPWTILHAKPPAKQEATVIVAVDLPERIDGLQKIVEKQVEDAKPLATRPAWHGTLLPKTDADIWLAAAFADYEKIVSREQALKQRAKDGKLSQADRERLAVELFAYKSQYLAGARASADVPLSKTKSAMTQSDWYRVAAGKGVLVLHDLRELMGDKGFDEMVDQFGRKHAGKQVTSAQFQEHVDKTCSRIWDSAPPLSQPFFETWLNQTGLPTWRLGKVAVTVLAKSYRVEGEILRDLGLRSGDTHVFVKGAKWTSTSLITLSGPRTTFRIESPERPTHVVLDPYAESVRSMGGAFSVLSFTAELERTLIVYGAADELHANREAAETLQRSIIERWSNYTVPVKTDKDVTDEDLKAHHLLLIGRPDSNTLVGRFRAALPITFGSRSFQINRDWYAHADSAVIAAGENPANKRYSVVVVAGLSGAATLRAAPKLMVRGQSPGEVLLLAHGLKPRALVLPAKELVRELPAP